MWQLIWMRLKKLEAAVFGESGDTPSVKIPSITMTTVLPFADEINTISLTAEERNFFSDAQKKKTAVRVIGKMTDTEEELDFSCVLDYVGFSADGEYAQFSTSLYGSGINVIVDNRLGDGLWIAVVVVIPTT